MAEPKTRPSPRGVRSATRPAKGLFHKAYHTIPLQSGTPIYDPVGSQPRGVRLLGTLLNTRDQLSLSGGDLAKRQAISAATLPANDASDLLVCRKMRTFGLQARHVARDELLTGIAMSSYSGLAEVCESIIREPCRPEHPADHLCQENHYQPVLRVYCSDSAECAVMPKCSRVD